MKYTLKFCITIEATTPPRFGVNNYRCNFITLPTEDPTGWGDERNFSILDLFPGRLSIMVLNKNLIKLFSLTYNKKRFCHFKPNDCRNFLKLVFKFRLEVCGVEVER